MRPGMMTTAIAQALHVELASQKLEVLYGHGQMGIEPAGSLGKLRSWFGEEYKRGALLADLDIAIVLQGTDRVLALIEIEETSNNPKLLIGDVMATLLGDQLTFRDKRHLLVGPWTTLIIVAHIRHTEGHTRIAFLERQVNQIKATLSTPNATIGRVVMDSFQHEDELGSKLRMHVQTAVTGNIDRYFL